MSLTPVRLSAQDERLCLDLMVAAHAVWAKWAPLAGKRKGKAFLTAVLKGEPNPLNCIPEADLPQFTTERKAIERLRFQSEDFLQTDAIQQGGSTVELAILSGYEAAVRKLAKSFSARLESFGYTASDAEQDARVALLNAIYRYDGSTAFTTFAWNCMVRALTRATHEYTGLSVIEAKHQKLLKRVRKLCLQEAHLTFDDLCERLDLSEDERLSLVALEAKVFNVGDLECQEEVVVPDYTAFGKVMGVSDEPWMSERDFEGIMEIAKLTDFERLVMEHAQRGVNGWQEELAKDLPPNPRTGKRKTRQLVSGVYAKAKKKMKRVYEFQQRQVA